MSDNSSKKLSELKECPCCKSNAGVFYLTPNGEKIQIGFDEIGEEVKRVQEAERLYGGKRTKAHCLACGEDLGTFNTDIINSYKSYEWKVSEKLATITSGSYPPNSKYKTEGTEFVKCDRTMMKIFIPDDIKTIKDLAFSRCSRLREAILPDSVTEIGEYAFQGCVNLKSITIPDGVTSINKCVFMNCKALESVDIPDSVTSIDENAFAYCKKSLLTIKCSENSYAAKYAADNGIKVEYTDPILTLERSRN